jgi:NAD(P)-dependent dehydrogenase (short-subunit alcohol dehydrogenase family)
LQSFQFFTFIMAFVASTIKAKWLTPGKVVKESFQGQNIIVTGANSGIGFEAAVKFSAIGASKVILAVRDLQKGEAAKTAIEARTGIKNQLEVWQLDMNSFDSVVAFAKRAESLDHLSVALLNAGVRRVKFGQSKEGWEEDLQVHVLSSMLLGILLLPKLKASKASTGKIPVLEFVNSSLVLNATISPACLREPNLLQAYNKKDNFEASSQYAITKLLLMYATNVLASGISSQDVIITSVCPGFVKTDLARDSQFPGVTIVLGIVAAIMMRSPEQGARALVSATTEGERVHGGLWRNDTVPALPPSIAGEGTNKMALRVWREVVEVLEKAVPAVSEALKSTTSLA